MKIVDLIIIFLVVCGIWMGYRRGFILQIVHLLGFIIAYIVAFQYVHDVAPLLQEIIPYPFAEATSQNIILQLVNTEGLFYSALAFALLFLGTKMVLQLLGRVLHVITFLPGLNLANRWLGGTLGLVEVLLIIIIVVHILLFLPWETGQLLLSESIIVTQVREYTPLVADLLKQQLLGA